MPLPSWNLNAYYTSPTDDQINTDLATAEQEVHKYKEKYRGRIGNLTPNGLLEAIEEVQKICVILNKPGYYYHLLYEAGGELVDDIGQIRKIIDERTTMITNKLAFFDVELCARKDLLELAESSELATYAHYLKIVSKNAKYILSEDVEKVLALKSLTSGEAWAQFYTDQKAKIEVELTINGVTQTYNVPGLMDLLKNTDREVRRIAFEALGQAYKNNEENVLDAYNNLIQDKKINDTLRGYQDAEEAKLLSNQISQSFVDSLVETCKDKVAWNQRYFRLKNEILGLEDPAWYDAYAQQPGDEKDDQSISWEKCQEIILETFGQFHPRFAEIAKEAFDNNWIDAQLRSRKYGGAFCSSFAPGFHPVILCNYKNKLVDVSTVAHELGHLIHSVLTEENQSLWNCNYTMSMAEIASLCCETIVFERLYSELTEPRAKLRLLCEKIEEESGNIFMGGLGRYTFESKVHKLFRERGALSKDIIRDLWLQENFVQVYGDVYNYPEECKYTWQSVAHFTYIFYNYVYASGLLISSAIYQVIKDDEVKKGIYIDILRAGGSDSPANLMSKLGLDIESGDFWQIGFKIFEDKIEEAERLWAEVKELEGK
jgi:oligoendopeptidase F